MGTHPKIALVTGGNSGIGLATARGLVRAGFTVLITGRSSDRLDQAKATLSVEGSVEAFRADFSVLRQVRELGEKIAASYPRLDVLIHNAGVWHPRRQLSADGYEDTFAVNLLAPFLLTEMLRDLLSRSAPARLLTVSSRLHEKHRRLELDEIGRETRYRATHVYGQTKLAAVLFANELARRLRGTGVTSNSLHPGDVPSAIARESRWITLGIRALSPFPQSAEQAAETSIFCATASSLEDASGCYFKRCRVATPSPAADDRGQAERLWEQSEAMVAAATHRPRDRR